MSESKFTFTGLQELRSSLQKTRRDMQKSMITTAVKHAKRVMKASQRLVPLDTGDLKLSGEVSEPEITDTSVTVDLVYGSSEPTSNYAIVQHERLDFQHSRGRQAKYLEQPLLAMADDLTHALAETVKL